MLLGSVVSRRSAR